MTLKISVSQLSLGMQGDDVVQLQQALRSLGRFVSARESRVMGPETVAVLKGLQAELGLPATGIVDAATVKAINAKLDQLSTERRVVRGSVLDANGKAFTNAFVEIFSQGPNGEQVIGKSPLNATDGSYEISYVPPPDSKGRINLRVAVLNSSGLVETTPSGTSILTNAGTLEVIDFVLSGEGNRPRSEFELITEDLKPLLGDRFLSDLEEDEGRREISLLASRSGYPPEQIASLVVAHKLSKETETPAPVLYGLLRQDMPTSLRALHGTDPDTRLKALQTSIEQNIVPKEIDGKKLEEFLRDFTPAPAGELQGLLGRVLNADELNSFVGEYLKDSQNPEAFWKRIAEDPVWTGRAADLKLTVQLGALTNNHVPLVNAVKARPDIKEASDLTRLTEDEWTSLIEQQGVPTDTPGADADEKRNNYLRQIVGQVEAAFPTRFLAERLDSPSPIAKFLKSQPSFDLNTTYPEQFFKQNPSAAQVLSQEDKFQLRTFQRLYRLTHSAKETIALAERKQVGSAYQIARMDPKVFAAQNQDILTEERAREVHEQARRTNAVALALWGEHGSALNRTSMYALPKPEMQNLIAESGIPDWETLFGRFDLCACQECSSVDGPAAYFVDALQFLRERVAKDALFGRRPDLGEIELSCENTNTVLPYVDLVNEILENGVVAPSPFAPFTLAPALEDDLGITNATETLAAAFNPPLQAGARVEAMDDGKRWRIWDESFAYSIVKENNALKVAARSRQTSGTTEERRATPQYRNSAAYTKLSEAVYPWNLPFNLYAEEANVFLKHLGVSRGDLIEALRPQAEVFDPTSDVSRRLAAERLGLTDVERKIIVDEPLDPPRQPQDFWDGAQVTALETVRETLDRSGLSYTELEALLATWFINPDRTLAISPKPGAPIDTCDATNLKINNLTADVLNLMHRFVRLWRKLGWTIPEVDKAIRVITPDAPSLTNEVLVRLSHLVAICTELRITVAQALALWGPIDAEGPQSLYDGLFYNPAVFKPQEDAFRLNPDGTELAQSDQPLMDYVATLQAVFRLNSANFELLVRKLINEPEPKLTLSNLSLLYRHAITARQLGLPIDALLIALDLTGLDPFNANESQDTLRFVEVVKEVGYSGFTFAELDYLLRHRFNPASPFVPTESDLRQILKDVRADLRKLGAESDAEKRKFQVIDRVATALSLPVDVAGELLGRVSHHNATALEILLELSEIDDEAAESLSPSNVAHRRYFETVEKLLKIATILQTLKLPASLLDWLFRENEWLVKAHDQEITSVDLTSWLFLIQLQQLRRELTVEDAALEAIIGAMSAVAVAADQPAREMFADALWQWLGWSREDVESLVGKANDPNDTGLLNAVVPEAYRGLGLLLRMQRVMILLKRLGVTAARASKWCEDSLTDADAKAIRRATKARYDDEAWQKIVTPLQNSLRDKQREALVAYLIARPEAWASDLAHADAADLYAHFLIDVEMSSCQITSRIKQAMGSVQLFAQRCLMGLEPQVRTKDAEWKQWEWMKNYRVWQANRKIWLYPENWIEPELRDDKTPFFKDLENELLQSDLDDAAAEQALLRYLEKLDEVARLEIVGVYEDDEDKTLHVFGRAHNAPHIYYYRRRVGATRAWKPWEKLELDIEGDHLIPVVWNRRLMLIWPVFIEKAAKAEVEMPEPGKKLKSADPFWEIQLAWSEYQHGRWSGKNLSDAVTFAAYQGEDNILFGPLDPWPQISIASARSIMRDNSIAPDTNGGDGGNGGGGGGTVSVPPRNNTSTDPRQLVSKELFSFKAFAFDESLVVRGYLRRDYRSVPATGDSQIACVFGEFRFFGCRKIIATAHQRQIARKNFALAPKGTKFDHMWFTSTASGLSLFDGQFPVFPKVTHDEAILNQANRPASIAGDPAETLNNKQDIEVLDSTPWPFRLLVPHQDLQFVNDRPAFFMDGKRTFMITSTGTSGKRPNITGWLDANLVATWRADYFPRSRPNLPDANGGGTNAESVVTPLTVLAPGPDGRRVLREMVPVNIQPEFSPRILVPTFWTTREYRLVNFHHPYLCAFEKTLNRQGIAAVLSLETQIARDGQSFDVYQPEARVLKVYPVDEVEFKSGSAYEIYNWELFFHIPLLIATRLKANQRFAAAQRWFHFIFDPTGASGGTVPQRYWRTKPFFDRLQSGYEAESVKTLEEMIAAGVSDELRVAIYTWRENPFSPHAVARLRTTAYQKTVVMKYIDNLIAWGDQSFRRETLESLNEATQLYVLAAEILGRRPEVIERKIKPIVQTFNSLNVQPGGLSNALEQIELLIPDMGDPGVPDYSSETPDPPSGTTLYFCVPENDQLIGYWNTVSDRLFKLRHCMNIEGQVRQLPLFEPPIDPALLVRARAAGLSLGEVLSDINVTLPNYRFSVMAQKANELVAEVRSLGAGLLSALEKRDAEALSLLRSGEELRLLEAVREVRVKQIDEAKANIASLEKSREMVQARKDFYESREKLNAFETASLFLLGASAVPIEISAHLRVLAGLVQKFGSTKIGSPTTAGIEVGGYFMGVSVEEAAIALDASSSILNIGSQVTGRMADYGRRKDEWDHQANLATIELKQIDKQLIAAQIRLAVAEQDLRDHDLQTENAREVDQHLRGKFTNQDLYQWMIGKVSGLYFQSYQLAYELAKRAERCMQHELGLKYGETSFIRFGYWDSLKKGLLAGEHLAYDLKRLEIAYLDGNIREYELTKHISLLSLAPDALIDLKEMGSCDLEVPEWLFDLDTPGHYRRRIKMVSVTIPSVTGPYTSIHCKLQLLKGSFRQDVALDPNTGYDRSTNGDKRFIDDRCVVEAIVTSTGQNDSGLFEPAMRDERYLPFEGAGAISEWRLELPVEFKTFDYSTISDVVLHLRYTARDGGDNLRTAATNAVTKLLGAANTQPLLRLFSLRHEFPSEWRRFVTAQPSEVNKMTLDLAAARFPYFVQSRKIAVKKAKVIARTSVTDAKVGIVPGTEISTSNLTKDPSWHDLSNLEGKPGTWTFGTDAEPNKVEDVFVIFAYSAS
jgi:hypothetical protein